MWHNNFIDLQTYVNIVILQRRNEIHITYLQQTSNSKDKHSSMMTTTLYNYNKVLLKNIGNEKKKEIKFHSLIPNLQIRIRMICLKFGMN